MNLKVNRFKQLNKGQGMVEFALVLPLLLMLSLGIIEVGRLMVVYASVQAASREAARYTLAAGKAASGLPYYLDTAGITAAAGRIAVLTGASSVNVSYDKGPGTTAFTPANANEVALGDRVNIQVDSEYAPIFGLVPIQPFTISAVTTRTIIKDVSIYGNPGAGGGSISVQITEPTTTSFDAGDTIHFVAVASNYTGTLTWSWTDTSSGLNIGSSSSLDISTLPAGTHNITVQATDANGSATDAITITIIGNNAPVVTINTPSTGSSFDEGTSISFTGLATDVEDGDISASLTWTMDGTPIGSGANFSFVVPLGNHSVTASVTDSGGKPGSATTWVTINPKTPPVVTISSPASGSTFPTDTNLTFSGTATDTKDGFLSANLVWKLADGTVIGTGSSFNKTLAAGSYTITASVTDSDGLVGSASITLTIKSGNAPVVSISSPVNGSSSMQGVSIYLSATAIDTEDGNLTASLKWYSDISGQIGSGGHFYLSNLAPGTHKIHAEVTDSSGMLGSASVTITVIANTPPAVAINNPANNSRHIAGQPVVFNGTATDVQDGTLTPYINWYSTQVFRETFGGGSIVITRTYMIGTGAVITKTNLSLGTQTITAKAFDSGQLQGSAAIGLNIDPPVCPTASNLRFVCKNKPQCEKLVFDITTTSPNELQVDYLEVNWRGTSKQYRVNSVSFGGGSPDPIPLGANTGYTPVVLNGNPIWQGAFSLGVGNQYTRQLYINFSDYPGSGDPGTWNVYVRFKYCSTSQASTTTPVW